MSPRHVRDDFKKKVVAVVPEEQNLHEVKRQMESMTGISQALIWRGFRHRWEYNHRINRLGDFIRHTPESGFEMEADIVHTAASGTGPDTATFRSFFTEVKTESARFMSGVKRIRIDSHENVDGIISEVITISLPKYMKNKKRYTVLLNGFDLVSNDDADKLHEFHLGLTPPVYDSEKAELEFEIRGMLNLDCDSYECDGYASWELGLAFVAGVASYGLLSTLALRTSEALLVLAGLKLGKKFNITTDYELRVHYLIVGGDDDLFINEPQLIDNSYNFDKKTEITRRGEGQRRDMDLKGDEGKYKAGFVGITSLDISLQRAKGLLKSDEAMHLLQLDMNVGPQITTAHKMNVDLDLFFRNWTEGMWDAHIPHSLTASKDSGMAQLSLSVQFLQLKKGEITHEDYNSTIQWVKSDSGADVKGATRTFYWPPERNVDKQIEEQKKMMGTS